ncbi:MAG: hypothetical protein SGILL_004369 [Bacillariaceae sp.]
MNVLEQSLQLSGSATFDVATLFPSDEFPNVGSTIDLTALVAELQPPASPEFVERFLPLKLFVRTEMRDVFNELRVERPWDCKVLSGSPGVGKSILLFLVALFRAKTEPTVSIGYMRHVDDPGELLSAFIMKGRTGESLVDISFDRELQKNMLPYQNYSRMQHSFPSLTFKDPTIRLFVDGPKVDDTFSLYSSVKYFCTSGKGVRIKNHMRKTVTNIVLGGWKLEDLKSAVAANFSLQLNDDDETHATYFNTEQFDQIYFVVGGRIRDFMSSYADREVSTFWADEQVDRLSSGQADLSLQFRDCRASSDHIDSVRTLFRIPDRTTDTVDIIVDSQYIMRGLLEKIDGQEHLGAYQTAKTRNLMGAAATHFEELMHWQFSFPDTFASVLSSVRASGKGAEGVRQLTQTNMYWVPSIPNFVNLDSAIVDANGHLWCFQFTTSTTHGYKKRRLRPSFVNLIPALPNVSINDVTMVFVVPADTVFTSPDVGGEANVLECHVDCSSLSSVFTSVEQILHRVALTAEA